MNDVILGTDTRSIDNKGRIILPKFVGAEVEEKLVLILNNDYVEVKQLKKLLKELEEIKSGLRSATTIDVINFYQSRVDGITSCVSNVVSLDVQGRIIVKPEVKERYKLENSVTIEGIIDGFRIWNPIKLVLCQIVGVTQNNDKEI